MEKQNSLWWLWLLLLALAATAVAFFGLQNRPKTVVLNYDLFFVAWESAPLPVPALVGGCVAGGLILGMIAMVPGRQKIKRELRDAEAKLFGSGAGGSDWT